MLGKSDGIDGDLQGDKYIVSLVRGKFIGISLDSVVRELFLKTLFLVLIFLGLIFIDETRRSRKAMACRKLLVYETVQY